MGYHPQVRMHTRWNHDTEKSAAYCCSRCSAHPAPTTSVAKCTANYCAMSWPDSTIIAPVTAYHQRSCVETYSRYTRVRRQGL